MIAARIGGVTASKTRISRWPRLRRRKASGEKLADFERCAVLFDGNHEAAATAARAQWRDLKDAGHYLTYWQQNEQGRWEKKD